MRLATSSLASTELTCVFTVFSDTCSRRAISAAFAGQDLLARSYQAAAERGYLWHEFGDLHLLLP